MKWWRFCYSRKDRKVRGTCISNEWKNPEIKLTPEQKRAIVREEEKLPKLFTNYVETDYGILFYNEEERGKGYGRQISHVVMSYCREQGLPLCATWFANPTSERMNLEAGFRFTDLYLEHGYATYEGK